MLQDSRQAGVLTFDEGLLLAQHEIVRWADYEYDSNDKSDWQAVAASLRIFSIYERVRKVENIPCRETQIEHISSAAASI